MKITSIRAKLSVFLIAAAILTALLIGLITYRHTLKENEDLLDYQLRQIALSLRDQGVVADPSYYQQGDALDVVIQIWNSNGSMLYLSVPGAPLFDRATLGLTDVDVQLNISLNTYPKRWRVFSVATRDRIIQVAQPLDLRTDLAATAALRSLTPLLAFVPLMALLIWWTVGNSLLPLQRVANEVEQRDARSLEQVAETDLPSEVVPLITALNSLLARLQQAFSSQRAFVADAAHELRSPLTALKLQLQLLGNAPDDAAKKQALDQLNQGVDRSSHLIEQLLIAAQTDPADTQIQLQAYAPSTNIAELTRQTIADLFPIAQSRELQLELAAPEQLLIPVDAARLSILIRNLIDNAIRYTPNGGQVHTSVIDHGSQVELLVEDSGPGIAPSDRERVFSRFYRLNNHPSQQTGSGLGLSIVKNIVDQHGAQITLTSSALGGLKVSVIFQASSN
ncbi:ATP-binding protein [Undibacterium sp. 5I1]|uniref:ATP-binding protein n=1 Tax=unclassified Undibacterium TaxID=2630295 RepID=UPI002AB479BB|nr:MULTISPECIES: ATP-binding protein [unclassified Undibacterium]MDY7540385.1 ATP-binding protein [Undibacterium sp. 5I1]MEB0230017.1 ATP-binding protein [Undibacterium sp. 10I3]MEB0258037.1 ATP-binding protein [Undibacterium sp. 5I1]